jgi:membrane-associated phospholipid phosphatase
MNKYLLLLSLAFMTHGKAFSQNADINILDQINNASSTHGDATMKVFTNSFIPVSLAAPAAVITIGYLQKDSDLFLKGVTIAFASGLNLVATYSIKYAVKRQRPAEKYPFIFVKTNDLDAYSFPSTHTSASFATATSLSLQFPKWYVIVPSYAWATTVAYSRLHLGVHYPSDVLAGALIGTGCAYLSYKGQQWINRKHPQMKSKAIFF